MGLGSGLRCFFFLGKCCTEIWQQTVVSSGGAAFHVRVHGVQASLCRMDLGSVYEKIYYIKNHILTVDLLFSLINTSLTILPSFVYTDN